MFAEEPESQTSSEPDASDEESGGIGEDSPQGGGKGELGGQGGEGRGAEAGTDRIEQEGESGQTGHDAPEDDAGTPEDAPSRTD